MKRRILRNGITLLHEPTHSKSMVIEAMVKTGSNDEKAGIRGIAHFFEHMLFEGTSKRPDSRTIAAAIEDLGGEMNAYTNSEVTAYHIKVLAKHADKAIDVLSDMLLHSTFPWKAVEKERKVILKEIHMVLDDPRFYKWMLFERTLFRRHPMRHPTYGTVEDVSAMTRSRLVRFYRAHYLPKNMIITVIGGARSIRGKIRRVFSLPHRERIPKKRYPAERPLRSVRSSSEHRRTKSAYTVLGFLTCGRCHPDAYALDILEAVLGRGQSGRVFDAIRTRNGLSYEVGVRLDLGKDVGYIAAHTSTDKKKAGLAQRLMLEEFRRPVTAKEASDAKTFLEGNFILEQENPEERADELCFMEYMGNAERIEDYVRRIKAIPLRKVLMAQKKYFSRPYAVVVVGP